MNRRWRPRLKSQKDVSTPEAPQNMYYESVSARLGILQVVLYLSLFAFVVLSFLGNTELITYRNFYYFLKDLNASAETVDVFETDSVSYPTAESQSFALYRKGLAVAGNDSLTVFTATGRQTLSQSIQYRNPIAVGSGKYLLVYELGGTQYSLYNSYTQLYTGKSDYPIFGATVSESGSYALISRSAEYHSVVSLYSSNFTLINRYNRTGYVMGVSLNEKGTRIAILTSATENGRFATTLTLHVPREDGDGVAVKLGDSMGLSCAFSASGGIHVICTDGLRFVDGDGNVRHEYLFAGSEIVCAELGADGASVVLRDTPISQKNQVIVFDKHGDLLYNKEVTETVTQIAKCENGVFLVYHGGIDRLDLKTERITKCERITEGRRILAVQEDEILLCSPQKAEYLRFAS